MPDETGDPLYSLAHLTLINATAPELIYIAARAGTTLFRRALSR